MAKRKKHNSRRNPQNLEPGPEGDVVEMLGVEAMVRPIGGGVTQRALLSRRVSKRSGVVVGDKVECGILIPDAEQDAEGPPWMVTAVKKRRNALLKPDFQGRPQVVASNLDHVVVVVTPRDPPLRLGLIDRYMAASLLAGIDPLICLNKSDLDQDAEARRALDVYQSLGVTVVETTARGELSGVEEVTRALAGKRSVLVGHSGVGKSSLACALIPGLDRRIGEVNEVIGRGRHTTTGSSLLSLPGGGELVDTPGVRAFGLFGVEARQLRRLYPEFVEREDHCRFRECSHIHEPGCAVLEGVDNGEIDEGRYERYLNIHASLDLE